jgi:NAD(P)-dependent dehydrogenase (short-subunit alcohol dehydrogenase family)
MAMESRVLAGRRAIVIGGGSGIGFASARLLARDGAAVTIASRSESTLQAAQQRLADEGIAVEHVACDAMNGAQVRDAVTAASDEHGHLHIAVVVPGAPAVGHVLDFDDYEFSALVDGNVRPVYLLLKYAGRAMVKAGSGSFVAISSTAAVFAARYFAPYAAGKAAVDQLVRVAANELGHYDVRVNAVRPGFTRSGATEMLFEHPAYVAAYVDGQPIGRAGESEDMGEAVRYLAGPESSWVTGQLLTVDGGHTLRDFVDYSTLMDMPERWLASE